MRRKQRSKQTAMYIDAGYIVNDDDNQVVRCNITAGVPPAQVWCKDTLGPYNIVYYSFIFLVISLLMLNFLIWIKIAGGGKY